MANTASAFNVPNLTLSMYSNQKAKIEMLIPHKKHFEQGHLR